MIRTDLDILALCSRETVGALQKESGFSLEPSIVTDFRDGILSGRWELVERLLLELPSEAISDFAVS